jgi:hypothetical protein
MTLFKSKLFKTGMMKRYVFCMAFIIALFFIGGCDKGPSSESQTDSMWDNGRLDIPNVSDRYKKKDVNNLNNEPDSFRGIKFGTNIDEIKENNELIYIKTGYGLLFEEDVPDANTLSEIGLNTEVSETYKPEDHRTISCLTEDGKRAKIYKIKDDTLKIGETPLNYVLYHFYDDGLCGVQISFDDQYWYQMEELFFSLYGEQNDSNDGRVEWHKWKGDNIYIKLWLVEKNQAVKKGFVEYCYLPLQHEDQKAYQDEMKEWAEEMRMKEEKEASEREKSIYDATQDL